MKGSLLSRPFFLVICWLCASPLGAVDVPIKREGAGGSTVGFVDMDRIYREYPETKKARENYRQEVLRHKGELADRERALEDLKGEIDTLKSRQAGPADLPSVSTGSLMGASAPETAVVEPASNAPVVSEPVLDRGDGDNPSQGEQPPQGASVLPLSETGANGNEASAKVDFSSAPARAPQTPDMFALPKGAMDKDITPEELAKREALLVKRQGELEEARASSALALKKLETEMSKKILGRLYKALVDLAQEKGIRLVVDKSAILYGQDTIDLTEDLYRRVRGLPTEGNQIHE